MLKHSEMLESLDSNKEPLLIHFMDLYQVCSIVS